MISFGPLRCQFTFLNDKWAAAEAAFFVRDLKEEFEKYWVLPSTAVKGAADLPG
jgi:hypothetical protein